MTKFLATTILAVVGLMMIGCGPSGPAEPDEVGAWVACQTMVKSRLKSPSTADFPADYRNSVARSGSSFTVKSFVDSQNSFGATVRTNYICEVRFDQTDESWNLTSLDM